MDVASDPTLRACVKAARAWGVSLSVFMGARPITINEFNARGQLVRSTTSAAWTEGDREAAFALMAYEAQCCPSGHYLPDNMPPVQEEEYEAEPVLCVACVAQDIFSKKYQEHHHPDALLFSVRRKQEETADEQTDLRT